MDKIKKCSLAIYDEHQMQRELLHHQLERMRFEILFSSKSKEELQKYIQYHSPDILLANSENGIDQLNDLISILTKKNQMDGIVFYNCFPGEILSNWNKNKYGINIYYSTGGFANLISLLDDILDKPIQFKQEPARAFRLLPDNPFYKIVENEKYIRILEMLKDGLAVKQIADMLEMSEHTVNTYIKRMHEETGYNNSIQLVYKAREFGLI